VESQSTGLVKERRSGELPIDHHILGKARAEMADRANQHPVTSVVFAIPGAVGFHVQGQRQAGAHDTDHDHLMVVAQDLSLPIPVGTAPAADLLARARHPRAVHGQPDEEAVVEGLVALGLADGGDGSSPIERGTEPLGEIPQRIIAEALGNGQPAAGRTRQGFNAGEAGAA
jgi:hypothetical protein